MIQAEAAGGGRQLGLVDGDPGEPDAGRSREGRHLRMVHQQAPAGAEIEGVVAVEQEAALVGDLGERQAVDGVEIFEPVADQPGDAAAGAHPELTVPVVLERPHVGVGVGQGEAQRREAAAVPAKDAPADSADVDVVVGAPGEAGDVDITEDRLGQVPPPVVFAAGFEHAVVGAHPAAVRAEEQDVVAGAASESSRRLDGREFRRPAAIQAPVGGHEQAAVGQGLQAVHEQVHRFGPGEGRPGPATLQTVDAAVRPQPERVGSGRSDLGDDPVGKQGVPLHPVGAE